MNQLIIRPAVEEEARIMLLVMQKTKEESDNMIGIITDQDVFRDYNEKSKLDTHLIRR